VNYLSFQVGSSVFILGYGPYRGLRGTIRGIAENVSQDRSFNFYLVSLEGKNRVEHMWFQYEDLGSVCLREVDHVNDAPSNLKVE
jgi:hypothetical protein